MNYKELEAELQNTLPKRKPKYQNINVNAYVMRDGKTAMFLIAWRNDAGQYGTIAKIETSTIQYTKINDKESHDLIMEFAKQPMAEKLKGDI